MNNLIKALCLFAFIQMSYSGFSQTKADSAKNNPPTQILAGEEEGESIVEKYARIMGVSDSVIVCPYLYVLIDDWLKTPYKYGGNSKRGTDCSGFVGQILKNFTDKQLPRSAAGMSQSIKEKEKDKLVEGDLVFFHLRSLQNKHVGIYLHNGWFVHASSVNGVTLSRLDAKNYQRRYSKCGSVDWNLVDSVKDEIEEFVEDDL